MGRGTSKPCPGCKEENTGRPIDGLCAECQRFLEAARRQEKADAERKAAGEVLYYIPWFWPHIYLHGARVDDGPDLGDRLEGGFLAILRGCGRVDERGENCNSWKIPGQPFFPDDERQRKSDGKRGCVWLRKEGAAAIAELDQAVRDAQPWLRRRAGAAGRCDLA